MYVLLQIHNGAGFPGLFRCEHDQMVVHGDRNIRDRAPRVSAGEVLIKGLNDSLVSAAVTTGDAVFPGDGNFLGGTAFKIIQADGLPRTVQSCPQLCLGAHNVDVPSAPVEGAHGKR